MSHVKALLKSLRDDAGWFLATSVGGISQLTIVEGSAMFIVRLDGRLFVVSDFHRGEWKWFWPWTRRRIARAAQARAEAIAEREAVALD